MLLPHLNTLSDTHAHSRCDFFGRGIGPVADTSTWQHTALNKTQISMRPVEFELVIPVRERPQTHALDRAANGIGLFPHMFVENIKFRILFHNS